MYFRLILAVILIIILSACGSVTPPRELAPDGSIVKKAIALSISQKQQQLVEQLETDNFSFEISQINVTKLEPVFIGKLPTYHLQGSYNMTLKLPLQQVKQESNPFDIFLQRQIEGKTWRLLKREVSAADELPQWSSYLVH